MNDARPRIHIETLGCKLNQAESERLVRDFIDSGYETADYDSADIIILNTCTVTHIADRKARHLVRMMKKANPGARVVVTGCYAERAANEIKGCGADLAVSNREKTQLPLSISPAGERQVSGDKTGTRADKRVRSFLKVQDGCRNYCSYCIVPLVRSDVFSVKADRIIAEALEREQEGYREIVLTGTEIGSYSDVSTGLPELIGLLLKRTVISRIHLSSLQPQHITDGLLRLWQSRRLVRHFHLALQSGSDDTLKRMNRRYTTSGYRKAVETIRKHVPDASVTTDIIEGFPGETEAEFDESYRFCQNMQFTAMHIFSYSPRPGTAAAGLPGRVNEKTKKGRSLRMLKLAADSADAFARRFTGRSTDVLWENDVKAGSGIYTGLTDNYLRAYTRSSGDLSNSITEAKLIALADEMTVKTVKSSTRGNHGEIWSVIET